MKNSTKILTLLSLGFSLSGCDSMRNTLGLDHYQPDEFNIADNPPLSMPRDYNLRPPMEGRVNVNGVNSNTSTRQAEQTLLGVQRSAMIERNSSQNVNSLIDQARQNQQTDPQIRAKLDQESKSYEDDDVISRKLKEIKKNATSIYKNDETPSGTASS